ncbi:hypothetical protein LINGRAHAP2_LOCUS34030 [Linum grandiflorum]
MEYYYYYCSSSSKKVMIATITTTLLLIIITTAAGASPYKDPQACSKYGPADSGACKGYYPYCVAELMTELISNAPQDGTGYTQSLSYPDGNPTGGVSGEAICVLGDYPGGCRNCLLGIKETLDYNCYKFEGGSSHNQYCSIKYYQIGN